MRINHEEKKNTKKDHKKLRVLLFFVVDSRRSLHVMLRRPETVKIGGECGATCEVALLSQLVPCRSRATSAGCATFSEEGPDDSLPGRRKHSNLRRRL